MTATDKQISYLNSLIAKIAARGKDWQKTQASEAAAAFKAGTLTKPAASNYIDTFASWARVL